MKKTLFVVALVIANAAFAQQTAGDMSGKAAQKLSKNEVQQLLSGAQTSGQNPSGLRYTMDYKGDGTLSGYLYGKNTRGNDKAFGMSGNWTVNDDGQLCREYTVMYG